MALHMLDRSPATELHLYPGNQHLKTVHKFQTLGATSQPHNQSASLTVLCKKAHFHLLSASARWKATGRFKLGCKIQEAAAAVETEIVLYGVASMKLVHEASCYLLSSQVSPRVQRCTAVGAGVGVGSWLAAILSQHSTATIKLTSNKHYPHVRLC